MFWKKVRKKTAAFMVSILFMMMILPYASVVKAAVAIPQATNHTYTNSWPTNFIPYTDGSGNIIYDPTNEPGISPDDVDFTSGALKGKGDKPSFYVAGDGTYLFFRMRLLGDVRDDLGGYLSSVWLVKLISGGTVKAVVGLNGKSPSKDYVYVANANGSVVKYINETVGTGTDVPGTRVTVDSNGDYLLDIQVPIAALSEIDPSITGSSILQYSLATSKAANLAVINKETMDVNGAKVKLSPFAIYSPTISFSNLSGSATSFPGTTPAGTISGTTANVANGQQVTLTVTPPNNGTLITGTAIVNNNAWSVTGLTSSAAVGSYLVTASVVNEVGDTATISKEVIVDSDNSSVTINNPIGLTGTNSYSTYSFPTSFSGGYTRNSGGSRDVDLFIYKLSATDPSVKTQINDSSNGSGNKPKNRYGVTGSPGSWDTGSAITYLPNLAPAPGNTYEIVAKAANNYNIVATQRIKYLNSNISITQPTNNYRTAAPEGATPTVLGKANPNEKVELYLQFNNTGGYTLFREVTADTNGDWSVKVDRPLSINTNQSTYHQFKAQVRDDTGTIKQSVINYGIDSYSISIENGSYEYVYINNLSPTVRGRSTDTAVNVKFEEVGTSNTFNLLNVPVTSNRWSAPVSPNVLHDNATYIVTATAAHDSAVSATLTLRTKSSTSISITSPVTGSTVGVNQNVVGTAEPGAIIDLNINNSIIVQVAADESGNWTYLPSGGWTLGAKNVIATTSDVVGNTATADTDFTVGTTYTVSFNSSGGSAVTALTASYNTTISAPTTPTKPGYTFGGWYKEEGLTNAWDFASDRVAQDTTLYAKWTANGYTVSFNSGGGSTVTDVPASYNTTITAPTAPTKPGYTFGGWYKEEGLTNAWDFASDRVAQDTTLYAKWTANGYTVAFNSGGGSSVTDVTAGYNTTINAPTTPTKPGYTFGGWYKEEGLTNAWDFASDRVSQETTLYAKWTANSYTVSFNSGGGSTVTDVTASYNTTISAPTVPTKQGYTFGGWYKEEALTNAWDFTSDRVAQDTTLYAKWTANGYTVSFNSGGGSTITDVTASYNTTINAPTTPTKSGYTFGGWYKEAGLTNVWDFAADRVAQDTTLYAKWTGNSYTVSFNSSGGSAVTAVTASYNTTISAPTAPTKSGNTFGGWYKEEGLTNAWDFASDRVAQDTTLYAKWTANGYTVSFNSSGGSAVNAVTASYNTTISAPTVPTKPGYTFGGWYKEEGLTNAWDFASDRVAQDTTLYAKWTGNSYTLSFNSGGGSSVADVTAGYNTTISAPPTAPTKAGYTFGGWYKEEGLTNAWDFASDRVAQDTTLYAKWTANGYTVSFNSSGGTAVSAVTVEYNTTISAPTAPTKQGYTFGGWYKEEGLTNAWDFASNRVAQDTTLYAKWTLNSYTINFNSSGGTAVSAVSVSYNTTISAPTAPTKPGYTFGGWYKEEALTNAWDFASDRVAQDTTLYAKWKNSNSSLGDLSTSAGALTPSFATDKLEYSVNVGNEVNSATITPTVAVSTSAVTVAEKPVTSGSASEEFALQVGANVIPVQVTAEDGTQTTYKVTITRAPYEISGITGILYSATGRAVPGITVGITDTENHLLGTSTTDETGRYTISNLPSVAMVVYVANNYKTLVSENVNLQPNKVTTQDLHFPDIATITLNANPQELVGDGSSKSDLKAKLLYKADGAPIVGANVKFTAEGAKLSVETALTNGQGEAVSVLTAPLVKGLSKLKQTSEIVVHDLETGVFAEQTIQITYNPAVVKGIVTLGGKPVAGAKVKINEDLGDPIGLFTVEVTTGPDGSYSFIVPLANHTYTMTITAQVEVDGHPVELNFDQKAVVGASGQGEVVTAANQISGKLYVKGNTDKSISSLFNGQNPVIGTLYDGQQALKQVTVEADGRFKVDGLQPGTYRILFQLMVGQEKLAGIWKTVKVSDNGEIAIVPTLIDPYGIVTDSVTKATVPGIEVQLYWANTELNLQKNRTPDTRVPLPELTEFTPNQNHNPQLTTFGGEYAWLVFADGDYYIKAEKSGYTTYDSRVEGRNVPAADGEDSFIQNGIIHVGQTIIKYDFSLVPQTGLIGPIQLGSTAATETAVQLTWNTVSGATYYHVYKNGSLLATVTTDTYNVTGLSSGTEYSFVVVAGNDAGQIYSNTWKVTTESKPAVLAVAVQGTTQVGQKLTGSYQYTDADNDAEAQSIYRWYRATDSSGSGSTAITGATDKTYVLQNDDAGKYISFAVTPVAATGSPITGNQVKSAYVGPITVPGPIQITISSYTETTVNLAWNSVTDAVYYSLYGNGKFIANVTGVTYSVYGLSGGTTYPFYVIAKGTNGPLAVSNTVSVTTSDSLAKINEDIGKAAKNLEVGYSKTDIWESVTLPVFLVKDGDYGTLVGWESNNEDVVKISGVPVLTVDTGFKPEKRKYIATVNRQAEDVDVILTATVTKGNGTPLRRTFLLVVKSNMVNEEKVTVPRGDNSVIVDGKQVAAVVTRTTLSDNKIIDKLVVDETVVKSSTASELILNLSDRPNNSSSKADQLAFEVPIKSIEKMGITQALQVSTPEGGVKLASDQLEKIKEKGYDLYFVIVPIRDQTAEQASELKQEVSSKAKLNNITLLDIPREIKTNITKLDNIDTEVILPLTNLSLPQNPVDLRLYLNSLRVFVQHTDDNTTEVIGGAGNTPAYVVYDANGKPTGLRFNVKHFSTFTLFQEPIQSTRRSGGGSAPAPQPQAPVTMVSSKAESGSALIEISLSGKVDYVDEKAIQVLVGGKAAEIEKVEFSSDKSKLLIYLVNPVPAGYQIIVKYVKTAGSPANAVPDFEAKFQNGDKHERYVQGYPDGTFKPENLITRAEMAAILARLLGKGNVQLPAKSYPDVTNAHWASSSIEVMMQTGIMRGYDDGLFKPEQHITRGEFAATVLRFMNRTAIHPESYSFPDIVNHWARDEIETIKAMGYMIGENGLFYPSRNLTRNEAVKTLNRVLKRGPLTGDFQPSWPDVPRSNWGYGDVEEASRTHEYTWINDNEELLIRFID